MSSTTATNSYYAPLPNPQTTNPTQYYLLQTLGQGTRRREPVPHPAQNLTPRANRRRHVPHATFNQSIIQNTMLRRARNMQRGHTLGAREAQTKSKLREQAKKMQENLDRYGISHPKELILKADISVLGAALRAITAENLNAMREFAVALEKAGEDVPAHTAMLFNSLMGIDLMMPLEVRTFEIAIR